ncbi:MAG: hypothetical protein H3C39_05415 [Flavobacteriia bacterium]|nr:hypothetical protein [Flavobacteriia bacterium]
MNLNCECYEYKAVSMDNQNVILNYCYHPKSPKINPNFFSEHNDFFLNEYYKLAKRPYLKFSIETDEFKISYTATELVEKKIDDKIFELN